MEGGGKWSDYGERASYATPRRLMLMDPVENFKEQIQVCIIEK